MLRSHLLALLATALLVSACSTRNTLSVPSMPQPALQSQSKTFGVGLSAVSLLMTGGTMHEHDYCQTAGKNFDSCPSYAASKKSVSYSNKSSAADSSSGTKLLVKGSGLSALGYEQYAQNVGVSNWKSLTDNASGQQHFGWEDTLHVTSGSHPKLTPVTVHFELVVTPSKSSVNCKYDPTADLEFTATGNDKNQSNLDVTGKCMNGKFVYTLDNGNGPKGSKDVGYENTSVGGTLSVSGTGTLRNTACQLTVSCPGSYSSNLAGSAKWRITKVTPAGVKITSDSGTRYTN